MSSTRVYEYETQGFFNLYIVLKSIMVKRNFFLSQGLDKITIIFTRRKEGQRLSFVIIPVI